MEQCLQFARGLIKSYLIGNSIANAAACLQRTHIHEQGQASDPLHGQDEEGDHGQVPAVWVALYPGQHLFENRILGAAAEFGGRLESETRKKRVN